MDFSCKRYIVPSMLQRKGNDFIFIDILLFEDPMKFTVKVSVEFRG